MDFLIRKYISGNVSQTVKGNDRSDKLSFKAIATNGTRVGGTEPSTDRLQERDAEPSTDRLQERDADRGSAPLTVLTRRERAVISQTSTGTLLKCNTGETSDRWGGAHMGFCSA